MDGVVGVGGTVVVAEIDKDCDGVNGVADVRVDSSGNCNSSFDSALLVVGAAVIVDATEMALVSVVTRG